MVEEWSGGVLEFWSSMKCKRCKIEMREGVALQTMFLPGTSDFIAGGLGVTLSPGGPGKLIFYLKCPRCGHSVYGDSTGYNGGLNRV